MLHITVPMWFLRILETFTFIRYLFSLSLILLILLLILLLAPLILSFNLLINFFSRPKPIRKHLQRRWLKKIRSGQKTYEGRLYRNKWETLETGDKLTFFSDDENEVTVVIEGIQCYPDFGRAYEAHPDTLLPSRKVTSTEKAMDVYREWYSDEEVMEYGVVVFEISMIN
jgi:ASC-1-like (ASCH) protein